LNANASAFNQGTLYFADMAARKWKDVEDPLNPFGELYPSTGRLQARNAQMRWDSGSRTLKLVTPEKRCFLRETPSSNEFTYSTEAKPTTVKPESLKLNLPDGSILFAKRVEQDWILEVEGI